VNKQKLRAITRRHFFEQAGFGVGAAALWNLLEGESRASGPAKAKNIIYLFMAGAPSHMDLFDNKPKLRELDGQKCPPELLQGERFAFIEGVPTILGSPYEFERHGRSGTEISELLPRLAEVVDEIAFVKSMHTTQFNHAPAQIFMNTGHQIVGRPSMGSWMTYGLGSENEDLPGFVVLLSGENDPDGGKSCWGSGFLPTVHQGVEFRSQGDPVLYLENPDGVSVASRRASLDTIRKLNHERTKVVGDPEIETRIAEIPSPTEDLAARAQWLAQAMQGNWHESLVACLLQIDHDCVMFSHYVAINAAVGTAQQDPRMRVFAPDNCSVTGLNNSGGVLTVETLGRTADTRIN